MIRTTHTESNLSLIAENMGAIGVTEYKFLLSNDCYVCTKDGRFFSVCARQYSKTGLLIEKYRTVELKGSVDKDGYRVYRVVVDGVKKHVKGHREVIAAWTGGYMKPCVNHIDGNKQNNALDNLEWCTVAENNAHAIKTGLFDPRKQKRKRKIPAVDWISVCALRISCGMSYEKIAGFFGVTKETVRALCIALVPYLERIIRHEENRLSVQTGC